MLTPRSYLFSRNSSTTAPSSGAIERRNDRPKASRRKPPVAREAAVIRDMSPAITSTSAISRPTTSNPMVIPIVNHREYSWDGRRHTEGRKGRAGGRIQQHGQDPSRARDIHSPDAIPPSVAALLALTSIPPQKKSPTLGRSSRASSQELTANSVIQHRSGTENELGLSLGRGTLDFLLSPPEEQMLGQDDQSIDSDIDTSYISSRTISSESVPSLDSYSMGEASLSFISITTPNSRGKRSLPKRRRLQSISSLPGEKLQDHPLSGPQLEIEELDFRVFGTAPTTTSDLNGGLELPMAPRRKSAFKSNLTASLKALKSAARTFSSITTPLLTPDDFLTRSIISIDPQVPFADERMPPKLEDTPTPALRRYLNPTTNAPIEAHVPSSPPQTSSTTKCTASIQMQTYRVSRSSSKSDSYSIISRRTKANSPEEAFAEVAIGPVARQRDMRENSDFIRVAVLEMMMRRHGKLDDRVPGRAKWALPPRKMSTSVYKIGEDGVPVRWIASTR